MKVHGIVPAPGQERAGERLDYFLDCSCRMETWRTIFAQLDIPVVVRPLVVIHACPNYSASLQEGGWRTLIPYPPCTRCQQWSALWLGLFLPDTTPHDIRPLATAHGIDLDPPLQSCGKCSFPREHQGHFKPDS